MEEFITKFINFVLFFVDAIKRMVAILTGKSTETELTDETTTAPDAE